jgi:prevent-host-death family protein
MTKLKRTWAVAKAKAQFSAVIDHALAEGPQTITRSGRPVVVVVSVDEWDRKTERRGTLADFFAASPLRGARLRLARRRDAPRRIVL